jgi:hypothetical protein
MEDDRIFLKTSAPMTIYRMSLISTGSISLDSTFYRVGRVLSFFSSRRNSDSPNPSPAGECAPPVLGGGGWRERGWESPNFDEGTYTVVLFIYTYFAVPLNSQILSTLF